MSNEHRMGNQPPLNVPVEMAYQAGDAWKKRALAAEAEVERLRAENDSRYPHGVELSGIGTLYGTDEACKLLGAKVAELEAENAELRVSHKEDEEDSAVGAGQPGADMTSPSKNWQRVQEAEAALRSVIQECYEDSREKSLALTKLDECSLWLFCAAEITGDMQRLLAKMRGKPSEGT